VGAGERGGRRKWRRPAAAFAEPCGRRRFEPQRGRQLPAGMPRIKKAGKTGTFTHGRGPHSNPKPKPGRKRLQSGRRQNLLAAGAKLNWGKTGRRVGRRARARRVFG
jgi:hypothetical protein